MVLVEPRRLLQSTPFNIEHETPELGIQRQRTPGYDKEFFTKAEERRTEQHRIDDPAAAQIQHDFFDYPEVIAVEVIDIFTDESVRGHEFRCSSSRRPDFMAFVFGIVSRTGHGHLQSQWGKRSPFSGVPRYGGRWQFSSGEHA
ncbi:hypothetical protein D3C85_1473990 [compost metagenome]